MKRFLCVLGLAAVLGGCSKPVQKDQVEQPNIDDPATLDKILSKAIDRSKVQLRGETWHLPNREVGYSGWIKEMYTDDGQVKRLFHVKDGKPEGLFMRWYDNGQKEFEQIFKDGKKEGVGVLWYDNGQKHVEAIYKNDKMDGLAVQWHENGQKRFEGTHKAGKREGLAVLWDENGQKSFEQTYKDDKLISVRAIENAEVPNIDDPATLDKILSRATHRSLLELRGERLQIKGIRRGNVTELGYSGWVKSFNSKGQCASLYQVKNGKKHGLAVMWYDNGQKEYEITFKDGKPEGLAMRWHENGHIRQKAILKNGKSHGLVQGWDEVGNLTLEAQFEDGERVDKNIQSEDADEQYNLGVSYSAGKGVSQDEVEAVKWWRKAAESGHAGAQYMLGIMYADGKGVAKDDAQAVKWYRKAADQGHAQAQHGLGLRYASGKGVAQDDVEAVKWWRKAAELGDVESQYIMGTLLSSTKDSSTADKAEAVKWYRKAADQGDEDAQYQLGFMYRDGLGVSKDWAEVFKWWRRAAQQGHVEAQSKLGAMYAQGVGVSKDPKEAIKWLRKAEEQGHAGARAALKALGELPAEAKATSPKGAKVYIIFPKDGKSVKKKFTIRFGLKGMGIAPAGIRFPNTGHHHLIIDGAKFDMNLPLPASEQIKHFGAGQTEATIELQPGKHTLQLVLGDHLHRPHDPPVLSKAISITVEE